MIKKVTLLFLVLFTGTLMAQKSSRHEKTARAKANEIKTVLGLSDDQVEKFYKTKLYFVKRSAEVRKDYPESSPQRKIELKKVNKAFSKSLKALIGEENKTKWFAYNKAKRKNK